MRAKIVFLVALNSPFSFCISNEKDSQNRELAIHYFMQGEFLLNQGNYALAVLEFQDALDIDPNASTIHISIADAYRRLGRAKRAEDHLKIAIDQISGDAISIENNYLFKEISTPKDEIKEKIILDEIIIK